MNSEPFDIAETAANGASNRRTCPSASLRWDIFCRVIDNLGDVGVCWRLAVDLAARAQRVRLWLDDVSALDWMAPDGCRGVEVRPWTDPLDLRGVAAGDVLVEAFGCTPPYAFVDIFSIACSSVQSSERTRFRSWINLEYLSAESFAERAHGLPSSVLHGPGAGLTKHFFYPGFTRATGGLLREAALPARQKAFRREQWLQAAGIGFAHERLVSLFCYEPPALGALLDALAGGSVPTRLLVTAGRASDAVRTRVGDVCRLGSLALTFLPLLPQCDYDHLLWSCDLNFVRGEDSLVRAFWAGQPFVWQAYPQHDGAHAAKVEALLRWLAPPASLAGCWRVWNSLRPGPLPALDLDDWTQSVREARDRLLAQQDLTTQLLHFVAAPR